MGNDISAIDRLEALLNAKDGELQEARELNEKLNRELDSEPWGWMRQSTSKETEGLPVPRLEIRWTKGSDRSWVAEYALVYRFFLGEYVRIPFSKTKQGGGWQDEGPEPPLSIVRNGVVETPFRDGAHVRHDMRHLNLPGYAICGKYITKLEPLDTTAPYEKKA